MSTKEQREKQQETLNKEKYRRDSQLAILKASNEMLEDLKENVREKWDGDDMTTERMISQLDEAQSENYEIGKRYLQAKADDINNSTYSEASQYYKAKYEKHLKDNNLTDEELKNKSYGTPAGATVKVTASADSKKEKKNGKWYSFMKAKKDEGSGEDIITEIDQTRRTVVGEGFIEDDFKPKKDADAVMKEIAESTEQKTVKKKNTKKQTTVQAVEKTEDDKLERHIENVSDIGNTTIGGEYPDFDPSNINPLTRYDIIELPSRGECYPSKKSRLPIRELTASDENLIASPNMYANGMLMETILKRCILDKNFDVDSLCTGDRDALILWLRATAYGPEYTLTVTNPDSGKQYSANINLADFKVKDFNLKGDENGYFDYTFENGDVAKFKILSHKEVEELQRETALKYVNQKKFIVYENIVKIERQVKEIFRRDLEDEALSDAIDYIKEWANKDSVNQYEDTLYANFVTNSMIKRTVSINGNDDRQYVEDYINNLRLSESKAYRTYLFENVPGMDFSITIDIPESDGGGSFQTTFQYWDNIFME